MVLLIDSTILIITLLIFVLTWSVLSTQLLNFVETFFTNSINLGVWLLAISFIIAFVIYISYFVFFETLWFGQTSSKRFAEIRVVRDDGRLIRLQQATLPTYLMLNNNS
ncbi:RDD family protein [Nostoc sp.]|uniref:RDD family protein n=1 Tax=Nostoc sp. TaxID=1180 RepID=UPI002FFB86EE